MTVDQRSTDAAAFRALGARMGTMGPLTCAAAALEWNQEATGERVLPVYFESFEQVRDALLDDEIDIALLPHCHPISVELLFDSRFDVDVRRGFDKPNPPLHLACSDASPPAGDGPATCAAIPGLWPLARMYPRPLELLPCVSNPQSAQAVIDGAASFAVTNDACLDAFGLTSVLLLKHVIVRWLLVLPAAVTSDQASEPLATAATR